MYEEGEKEYQSLLMSDLTFLYAFDSLLILNKKSYLHNVRWNLRLPVIVEIL